MNKFLLTFAGFVAFANAQPAASTAYTITELDAAGGQQGEMTIYRSGAKAAIDRTDAAGRRMRTVYDLAARSSYGWDLASPGACSAGTVPNDWGDPFAVTVQLMAAARKQNAKQTGSETVAGLSTQVFEFTTPSATARLWYDAKSALLVKAQIVPGAGDPRTLLEIRQVSFGEPPAATFNLPPTCAANHGTPSPDFVSATEQAFSRDSCAVVVRVVEAGSMQPVVNGFQLAVDPSPDVSHPMQHSATAGADGKATFSGGGIQDMTAQLKDGMLKLDKAPEAFDVLAYFGAAGESSARIYRRCFAPQQVLLFLVKNPARIADGGDWLWVKSGKYATVEAAH